MAELHPELQQRLAQVRKREHIRGLRKREWIVLGVFLFAALWGYFNLKRVVVQGVSMEPTLHNGQTVIVWKTFPPASLQIGNVIVLRYSSQENLIKRIVFVQNTQGTATPPRTVWTPKGARLFADLFSHSPPKPLANTIYVMGDNFENSDDSRDFGPINPQQIIGKVVP